MNGDGAARFRDVFSRDLPAAVIDDTPVNLALGAALLATSRIGDAVGPHALRPLYVRRPDAVLARERARAGETPPPLALEFAPVKTPDELAAVADLQRRSFANAWGAEAIRWELDNSDVARMYAARNAAGDVVAYCACWIVFDELHINSVAVEATRRRQGIARRLLEHVLAEAAAGGARGATLEVRQSNEAARRLYEGLGFKVEGVRRNYYQDPKEDALILWHRNLAGQFGRAER
jgi:ribosomal-protein-alanine N-acetyltransferase